MRVCHTIFSLEFLYILERFIYSSKCIFRPVFVIRSEFFLSAFIALDRVIFCNYYNSAKLKINFANVTSSFRSYPTVECDDV